MQYKAVVFDLDDVIVNLREQVYQAFYKEHGDHIPVIEDWYTYDMRDLFNLSSIEEGLNIFQEHQVLENARPEEHAFDLIRHYYFNDYRIFMITSRGWHPHGTVITEQWLKDYNLFDFVDNFYVTDMKECKSDIIKMLSDGGYKIEHLYEDQMRNIEPCIEKDLVDKAYLVSQPWNQDAVETHSRLFENGRVEQFTTNH